MDRLSHRMNWITGLHTAALLDTEGREEEDYELLQLASYGSGGFYKLHLVSIGPKLSITVLIKGGIQFIMKGVPISF